MKMVLPIGHEVLKQSYAARRARAIIGLSDLIPASIFLQQWIAIEKVQ